MHIYLYILSKLPDPRYVFDAWLTHPLCIIHGVMAILHQITKSYVFRVYRHLAEQYSFFFVLKDLKGFE